MLSEPAEARYGRRGWGGYPYGGWGWGWSDWPTYYGDGPYGPGYYDPYGVYALPQPIRPDPAYARLRNKCPAGRHPRPLGQEGGQAGPSRPAPRDGALPVTLMVRARA